MLPGSTSALILAVAAGGLAWFLVVGLLIRHLYRPWIAIAIAMVAIFFVPTLVYLTGGPPSPLDSLYPIIVFAAIIRFTRLHSILFTIATIVVYAVIVTSHPAYVPEIEGRLILTRAVILAATGLLAWLIAAEVARQRRLAVEAQQQIDSLTTISHIAHTLDAEQAPEAIMSAAIDMIE